MGTAVLAHGGGALFTFFPFVIMGAAGFFLLIALRDGSSRRPTNRFPPNNPLARGVHAALRTKRPERSTAPTPVRPPRRWGESPSLKVMNGGGAEQDRSSRSAQTFDLNQQRARRN